jgi:hypothetical protein
VITTVVLDEKRKRLKERNKDLISIAMVLMFNFRNFSGN